ncbi:MAG: CDP-glucose 4,6-dehydratase [Burkholderiales bacterium]
MEISAAFWRTKRVLVTGHSGFKGSWLTLWLRTLGAQAEGLSLAPATQPNLYQLAVATESALDSWTDVRDRNAVARILTSFQPEVIFHLAAQSIVRASYDDPLATFATNVMGTANVLEGARSVPGLRALVVVTSDKCYANEPGSQAFTESSALGANDPYSGSKACAELTAATWRRAFFDTAGIATARAGNVIGGGDWSADRLMTDLVHAAIHGQSLRLRNPNAVRPWQHVLDALSGYLVLAEKLCGDAKSYGQAWNFGPDTHSEQTVAQMVGAFSRLWDRPVRHEILSTPQPHESATLRLDSDRARRQLGWRPQLSTDEALAWTVEWYRGWHNDPRSARARTLDQLARYRDRLGS